jgi:hypothetical protein
MADDTRHHISTRVRKLGGSPIRGGGTYRCSEVHCSCGWRGTNTNGQTYAESIQEGREHLKEVGVYTTPMEQEVYASLPSYEAFAGGRYLTAVMIAEQNGRTHGRTQKVLDRLVERGHAVKQQNGNGYWRTDKWFSWND